MTKYIALLRGINVGGKNIIKMADLRAAFERQGLGNVSTYINSGNILFDSDLSDVAALRDTCEKAIADGFSLDIQVCVVSDVELTEMLAHAPEWWGSDPDSKHNAIFVIPPATAEEVCAEVGEIKPEYEKMAYHGKLIFWSAPVATFSRTRWSKISTQAAYLKTTIRNSNTAYKLAELVK